MPGSSSVWNHWHAHPDVIIGLALLLGAYLYAVGPMRVRRGLTEEVQPRQVAMFTGGVLVILLALTSPLHELSNNYLFSAHMIQHVALTLIAPPLLLAGTPGWAISPLLGVKPIRAVARVLTHPVLAFAAFNLMFSFWHFPALYSGSVSFHSVHIAEHLLFMVTGVMVWWPLMSNSTELPRLSEPMKMIYLLAMSIAQILVFAPITFSQQPIYQFYVDAPAIWGIGALVDQQAGGLIMKVGGGVLFMSMLIVTFLRWFSREETENGKQREENKRLALGLRQAQARNTGQTHQ